MVGLKFKGENILYWCVAKKREKFEIVLNQLSKEKIKELIAESLIYGFKKSIFFKARSLRNFDFLKEMYRKASLTWCPDSLDEFYHEVIGITGSFWPENIKRNFVNGIKEIHDGMVSFEAAYSSFKSYTSSFSSDFMRDVVEFCNWGFYYSERERVGVFCSKCYKSHNEWDSEQSLHYQHAKLSPQCELFEEYDDPEIMEEGYAPLTDAGRRRTFYGSHVPDILKIKAPALADACLYYTGSRDIVKCLSCGCEINNWKLGDQPFFRHRKTSPFCARFPLYDYCVCPNSLRGKTAASIPEVAWELWLKNDSPRVFSKIRGKELISLFNELMSITDQNKFMKDIELVAYNNKNKNREPKKSRSRHFAAVPAPMKDVAEKLDLYWICALSILESARNRESEEDVVFIAEIIQSHKFMGGAFLGIVDLLVNDIIVQNYGRDIDDIVIKGRNKVEKGRTVDNSWFMKQFKKIDLVNSEDTKSLDKMKCYFSSDVYELAEKMNKKFIYDHFYLPIYERITHECFRPEERGFVPLCIRMSNCSMGSDYRRFIKRCILFFARAIKFEWLPYTSQNKNVEGERIFYDFIYQLLDDKIRRHIPAFG